MRGLRANCARLPATIPLSGSIPPSLRAWKVPKWPSDLGSRRPRTCSTVLVVMPSKTSKRVLVVDDDDDLRDALVDLLETLGYRALGVASAEQALKVIHDDPCLVLMDWQMRQMDGPALLAAMRAELGPRLPPVVFITGSDAAITKNIAEPVLSKPVSVGALLDVLRRHCPSPLVTRK